GALHRREPDDDARRARAPRTRGLRRPRRRGASGGRRRGRLERPPAALQGRCGEVEVAYDGVAGVLQRRLQRLVQRLVHGEVPVEAGDLQRAARLEPGRREQERAAVCHLRARLDQDAERGRVYEAHVAEVDNEPFGRLGGRLEQRVAHYVRVVEVEL